MGCAASRRSQSPISPLPPVVFHGGATSELDRTCARSLEYLCEKAIEEKLEETLFVSQSNGSSRTSKAVSTGLQQLPLRFRQKLFEKLLRRRPLSLESFRAFASCGLEEVLLDFTNGNLIGDEWIQAIASGHQTLKRLSLQRCSRITDRAISYLALCSRLEALNLSRCLLISDGATSQLLLALSESLLAVDLSGNQKIGSSTMAAVGKCRKLRVLKVEECRGLSAKFVAIALADLHSLQTFSCGRTGLEITDDVRCWLVVLFACVVGLYDVVNSDLCSWPRP